MLSLPGNIWKRVGERMFENVILHIDRHIDVSSFTRSDPPTRKSFPPSWTWGHLVSLWRGTPNRNKPFWKWHSIGTELRTRTVLFIRNWGWSAVQSRSFRLTLCSCLFIYTSGRKGRSAFPCLCVRLCGIYFFSFPVFEPYIEIGMTSSKITAATWRTVFYDKNTLTGHVFERKDLNRFQMGEICTVWRTYFSLWYWQ